MVSNLFTCVPPLALPSAPIVPCQSVRQRCQGEPFKAHPLCPLPANSPPMAPLANRTTSPPPALVLSPPRGLPGSGPPLQASLCSCAWNTPGSLLPWDALPPVKLRLAFCLSSSAPPPPLEDGAGHLTKPFHAGASLSSPTSPTFRSPPSIPCLATSSLLILKLAGGLPLPHCRAVPSALRSGSPLHLLYVSSDVTFSVGPPPGITFNVAPPCTSYPSDFSSSSHHHPLNIIRHLAVVWFPRQSHKLL